MMFIVEKKCLLIFINYVCFIYPIIGRRGSTPIVDLGSSVVTSKK